MRFWYLPEGGRIDSLTLAGADVPLPTGDQVLVRMRAASLNYRDLLIGSSGRPRLPNLVPLSDGAGTVVEVGRDATRWKTGDRVAGTFYPGWIAGEMKPTDYERALGGSLQGVLTEYRLFEQDSLVRLPGHLSFEEAATLPCAALTAWNALHGARPLEPGQHVLVLGTGGVATFALQFAVAIGARVAAVSSSDAKLERAAALGARDLVNYCTHPEWHREIRRLTDGRGVDHVVEVGGAGTLERSLGAVRFGGSVHLIGVLTAAQINPLAVLTKAITLRGMLVGSRAMFEQMNDAISTSGLRPVVERVYPFDDVPRAYRELQAARHVGKLVIRFDS